jgi:transcription initiation factor TFIIIB Brf1 subunit/transcription initiation factor TFIIB
MERCRYCNSRKVFTDFKEGNLTCRNCGSVLESRIVDEFDETRNFGKDSVVAGGDVNKRVANIANNHLLSDSGLGTVLDFESGHRDFN